MEKNAQFLGIKLVTDSFLVGYAKRKKQPMNGLRERIHKFGRNFVRIFGDNTSEDTVKWIHIT
jgi:hypothetical protein